MLDNIRIILVCPSHPGNIGAVARAMKNMGLSELYLVSPKIFPSKEANIRASGADDLLDQACVVSNLDDALQGVDIIFGTSARVRTLEKPTVTPAVCAREVLSGQYGKPAIIFGRERFGLTNDELSLCHRHIVIPTVEDFSSLNLAAAVQVVTFALRSEYVEQTREGVVVSAKRELASADQVLGFYGHLQETLTRIGFLDPKQPKMLMQRLRRVFNRALLDAKEINILRGILSNVEKKLDLDKDE